MFKLDHVTGILVVLSLAAGIATVSAAETETQTMTLPPHHPLRSLPQNHPSRSGHASVYDHHPRSLYNYAVPHRYYHAVRPEGNQPAQKGDH
jgi:hypothetical protein